MHRAKEHDPPLRRSLILLAIVLLCSISSYVLAMIAGGPQAVIFGWRFAGYLLIPAMVSFLTTLPFKEILSPATFRKWLPLISGLPFFFMVALEFLYHPPGFKVVTGSAGVVVLLGVRALTMSLARHMSLRIASLAFCGLNVALSFAMGAPQYFDVWFE